MQKIIYKFFIHPNLKKTGFFNINHHVGGFWNSAQTILERLPFNNSASAEEKDIIQENKVSNLYSIRNFDLEESATYPVLSN